MESVPTILKITEAVAGIGRAVDKIVGSIYWPTI